MKVRTLIGVLVLVAMASSAAAQSVSGLSVKTRSIAEPTIDLSASAPQTVSDLIARILAAKTKEEREALFAEVSGLRVMAEAAVASQREEERASLRREIADLKAERKLAPADFTRGSSKAKDLADALAKYRDLADPEPAISLAVPAGATAAVGDDKTATAGPVLGFQAWRPDDFFAGAFFTFDTAAKLNGEGRTAGEFLRNPPATGTSFYAAASKMVLAINRDTAIGRFTKAHADDGQQLGFIGGAVRAGVTNATLERTVDDEVIAKEAFVFHVTPAILLTSRTFREASGGEYQFGLEIGWALRWIGGDAAHDKAFLSAPDVFGSDDTTRDGLDVTAFVRLNAFQPFVRFTNFRQGSGAHFPAFTGPQAFFGINVQSSLFQTAKEK